MSGGESFFCHSMKYYSSDVSNRCTFRNKPVHAGSGVYLPACFPPESPADNTNPRPLVLSGEESEEVCLQLFFLIIIHTFTVTLPSCVRFFFFFFLLEWLRVYTALRNIPHSLKYVYC